MCEMLKRKRYPSDLTAQQWALLEPLIPKPTEEGATRAIERREIVNAILYIVRSGCSWRQMPHDLPAWQTAYHYFRHWKLDGTWEKAMTALRKQVRVTLNREEEPSAAVIDSQSIKTSPVRGSERGFDAGKKNLWAKTSHFG
jgi:putative transposase